MNNQLAGMVEAYQLDFPNVTPIYEAYEPTAADIAECDGFDHFLEFMHGKLSGPQQPDNIAYMAGWRKHEKDWEGYEDFRNG